MKTLIRVCSLILFSALSISAAAAASTYINDAGQLVGGYDLRNSVFDFQGFLATPQTPEPGTLLTLCSGLMCAAGALRRRAKATKLDCASSPREDIMSRLSAFDRYFCQGSETTIFRSKATRTKLMLSLLSILITSGCNWTMYRGDALRDGRAGITNSSMNQGAIFWSVANPGFGNFYIPSGPVIGSGPTIYAGGDDGNLYAFNADGSLKWTYDSGIRGVLTAAAIASDGTVYATNGAIFAVSPNGSLRWKFTLPGPGIPFLPAIGGDGTLYFGDQCGTIYALAPTGTVKWGFTQYQVAACINGTGSGNPVGPAPAIATDGTIYAYIEGAAVLVALTPSGSLKWIAGFAGDPAVYGPTGTIYVNDGTHLTNLNPDGTFKWQISDSSSFFSQPAIAADGTIYLGTDENGLMAVNPDGSIKWVYRSDLAFATPIIGTDGTIFVSELSTTLHAVNPNGRVKWTVDWSSITTCDNLYNEPTIAEDGTIYIVPNNNGLECSPVNGPLIAIH